MGPTQREPVTAATDFVLAAVALASAGYLGRVVARQRSAPTPGLAAGALWSGALAASGVAAALGGLAHGGAGSLPPSIQGRTWKAALCATVAAGWCTAAGSAAAILPPRRGAAVALAAAGKSWLAGRAAARSGDYRVAMTSYALDLATVAAIHGRASARSAPSSPNVLAGVGVSLAAALVQASKWRAGRAWNHNDAYHLLQAVALWMLRLAAEAELNHGRIGGRNLS